MKFFKKLLIKIQQLATSILYLCLVVSLATFVIYLFSGAYYSDRILFFLLVILRYSSFILCVCSLYKLLVNTYHFFRRPSVSRAMKNLLYLVFIIFGIGIIIFESIISVIAGGNE
jgi:hypothetical protein